MRWADVFRQPPYALVVSSGSVSQAASSPLSAVAAPVERTLLEDGFPYAAISQVARADRYSKDHVYAVHKWWARRPPAVIRALLLAAALPAETSEADFWKLFAGEGTPLKGQHVGDAFMGGATTLVEAARLGADVTGIDVDPLAARVARAELAGFDTASFEKHAERLLAHLRKRFGELYPAAATGKGEPLHYFWLRRVECTECNENSLLYRSLILVRERGLAGAVVRAPGIVAFCPDCLRLHHLGPKRKTLRCCGRRRHLNDGTYGRARFKCPCCGTKASNEQLRVGQLQRVLVAVEEAHPGEKRRLREPSDADARALAAADRRAARRQKNVPAQTLAGIDSGRPTSYGFKTVGELFSSRQQLVLAEAFAWVRKREAPAELKEVLALALSNALGSNNLLCGYATDYGRLSSLFSGLRAYSMPVLSVELNPLHESAGRGTLAMTMQRMLRSQYAHVSRHAYDPAQREPVGHRFSARPGESARHVVCRSADRPFPDKLGKLDLVVTDPPYYGFIPYSDLSLLYRAWLSPGECAEPLSGAPIYPVGEDPVDEFGRRLGRAFTNVRKALRPGGLMTFTFHSWHKDAWRALERALRDARFRVSAVFPVWADGRAGSHAHAGNCEWDLVFVCRPRRPGAQTTLSGSVEGWIEQLAPEQIEEADRRSMEQGLAMANALNRVRVSAEETL